MLAYSFMTPLCIQHLSLCFQVASPTLPLQCFRAHLSNIPAASGSFPDVFPKPFPPHSSCSALSPVSSTEISFLVIPMPTVEVTPFYRRCCRNGAAGFSFRHLRLSPARRFG